MKNISDKNETSKIAKQTKEKLVTEKDFSDKSSKFSALQKWLRGDDKNCSDKRNSGRWVYVLISILKTYQFTSLILVNSSFF